MRETFMYGAGDVRVENVPGYRAMDSREALTVLVRP